MFTNLIFQILLKVKILFISFIVIKQFLVNIIISSINDFVITFIFILLGL